MAQEWTYRFLGAALTHNAEHHQTGIDHVPLLVPAGPITAREPSIANIRTWALAAGFDVAAKGRIRPELRTAYERAHSTS